jgi:hypothetical protein
MALERAVAVAAVRTAASLVEVLQWGLVQGIGRAPPSQQLPPQPPHLCHTATTVITHVTASAAAAALVVLP